MNTIARPFVARFLAGTLVGALALGGAVAAAHADDQMRANEARIVIDDALAQIGGLRPVLGSEAWRPLSEAWGRLQTLRSRIVERASVVGDLESRLDPMSTHVQRLRIEAESAIDRHNRRVQQHDTAMRGLQSEATSLDSRIRQHNATAHVPRTREQAIAYDAHAARLNGEQRSLQQRASRVLATSTNEITQLRVAASAKERAWTDARAEFMRGYERFEQERRALHGSIDEAVGVLQGLAGSARRALLAQAGHGLDMARDAVERPVGTPSRTPEDQPARTEP